MIPPRTARILGAVIVVSVALNLFIAGNLLGDRLRGPVPARPFDQRIEDIWRNLPEADQPIAREVVDRHRDQIMGSWRTLRSAAQHATQIVRADTFAAEDARAAFAIVDTRNQELRRAIQDTVIELAAKISPQGRAALRYPGP
jgi:uncharacterized membrane protein